MDGRNRGRSLTVFVLSLQEASASFAEWERLMKGLGSGVATTDNPFTQVMGLVTQMYKQTAIAKVMADQVMLKCSFTPLFVIIQWIRLVIFYIFINPTNRCCLCIQNMKYIFYSFVPMSSIVVQKQICFYSIPHYTILLL